MKMKKLLTTLLASAVAVSSLGVAAFAALDPGRSEKIEVDKDLVYTSNTWRDFVNDVEEGDVVAISFKDKTGDAAKEQYPYILIQSGTETFYTADVAGDLAAASGTFTYTVTADTIKKLNGGKLATNAAYITISKIVINPKAETPAETTPAETTTVKPVVPIVPPATQAPATQAPATEATTTQAPATQAPASDVDTQAPATEAPAEVVTAAGGESVAADENVIPEGAALEVKEQTKEEAVKAVEAVKATEANKEVVDTIKKAVESDKAAVVDIDLVNQAGVAVQPNGTVKVTINVPAALKAAAQVFVYRVEDDGTFTNVNAKLVNGKIEFSTVHFSTYVVTSEALSGAAVVTEAPAATNAPASNAPGTSATPSDKNQGTGVVLAIIPAALAAAGVIISKKRK